MKYIYVIGCVTQGNPSSFLFPTLGAYTSEKVAQERMDELKQYRKDKGDVIRWDHSLEWRGDGYEIRTMMFERVYSTFTETEYLYLIKYRMIK